MTVFLILGLGLSGITLAAIIWSIRFPSRRIWPPATYRKGTAILVWGMTAGLTVCIVAPAFLQWGRLEMLPNWVRFGAGIPLIVFGNLVVSSEVLRFGINQTGGAKGQLQTAGLYGYSRNPQYVADIGIVVGWGLLSASPVSLAVGGAVVVCLIAAPFAEEPWLAETYGDAYEAYRARVRRFL